MWCFPLRRDGCNNMGYIADVVIVGAGVVGSMIAREMSRYKVDIIVVEKSHDVGGYASKGNSGNIGAGGISPEVAMGLVPRSIIDMSAASRMMYPRILEELDVKFIRCGRLNIAFNEEELNKYTYYWKKTVKLGQYDAYPMSKEKMWELEPYLSREIAGGFYCADDLNVDVFNLIIACIQNALENGVRLMTGTKAISIDYDKQTMKLKGLQTDKGYIQTRYVINAAAIYADELARTTGICGYVNYPRYGQFYVLDKNLPYSPKHTLFPLPSLMTVGRIVSPTVSGNTLVGPSADNGWDKENTATTKEMLESVLADCRRLIPAINPKDTVTQFTGVRPAKMPADWSLNVSEVIKGYAEAVGILQGVTFAPGIAGRMCDLLDDDGLKLVPKDNFNPYRVSIKRFARMSEEEREEAIEKDPRYGNVICRCETVTEAEIIQAIHCEPGARNMDAIKRRLRAGMGRCQGGFCSPRVVEILARELNLSVEEICKNEPGSEILVGKNRK